MRILIVIAAVAGLAGCNTAQSPMGNLSLNADAGVFPAGWQQAIKAQYGLPVVAAPPHKAQGPALLEDGSFATPWVVCIRQRSRLYAVKFHNGTIVGAWEDGPDAVAGAWWMQGPASSQCVGASYSEIAS